MLMESACKKKFTRLTRLSTPPTLSSFASGHQSTAKSVASLVVCEEEDEGEAELSRRGLRRTARR